MKDITSYKTPSPSTVENQQLADDLNEFYCRFEKTPFSPPATPLSHTPALQISNDDVLQVFKKNKRRKAPGPDGVSPACLKTCADQLAPIFTQIFNRSLELCEVPSCFKCSTIIPVPKKPTITGLNDYRPVALTSVAMKSFERLVLAYLMASTGSLLDPLQFAFRANRSVDDAVNMGLHFILQHLDRPGTYVRIMFVDFSSTFNTIIPDTLQNKLTQLSVPTSICQWITSFLTDRQQLVRLGKFSSSTRTISTGAPQGKKTNGPVFSPHCSSLSTRTTAHLKSPLSSSWSLQTTPHWSASSRTVTSLLTDRRLRSWLSGAVLTTWSLTRSKLWRWSWTSGEPPPLLSPHSPSWTPLQSQCCHSDSWSP